MIQGGCRSGGECELTRRSANATAGISAAGGGRGGTAQDSAGPGCWWSAPAAWVRYIPVPGRCGRGHLGIVDSDGWISPTCSGRLSTPPRSGPGQGGVGGRGRTGLNPEVRGSGYCPTRLCAANVMEIIRDYDFVIDGTDQFFRKFLINDARSSGIPLSHGGVLPSRGRP